MPLVNTQKMFKQAYDGGFAIGAFNVNNMELLQAIMEAAESEQAPVILQISKGARQYANIRYLKAMIDAAVAEHPRIPVAVHCDHGDTFELCKQCIADGYTSVMIDASHEPFEENVRKSKQVADYAHAQQPYVCVEAELGRLGGIEEEVVGVKREQIKLYLTDPDQAADFVHRTGVDSLAVAIGTSHGAYKFKHQPKLALDRLEQIMQRLPGFPLVMHGSSSVPQELVKTINEHGGNVCGAMGVPEAAIAQAARLGVCKVNIDTDLRLAMTAAIRESFTNDPKNFDPRGYLRPARSAVTDLVRRKLHVLGCAGKAQQCL
ncbi:MAG: class II fructose-1,6-bisphosphate aldolase [Phycisphaerae bacterium]